MISAFFGHPYSQPAAQLITSICHAKCLTNRVICRKMQSHMIADCCLTDSEDELDGSFHKLSLQPVVPRQPGC